MTPTYSLFMRQSYLDAWEDFNRSLVREDFPRWDYVVLTASNEAQAEAFRLPAGGAAGKGDAAEADGFCRPARSGRPARGQRRRDAERAEVYIREREPSFRAKRVLCIHSGGDSKRVPRYSACGKLFSPVPRELPNGARSTLFDEFMIGMSGVPSRISEGMLVLSGDVLLLFNPLQIDAPSSGAAAISFKEDVETGKDHGVFHMDEAGDVGEFLHKQPVETLKERGAVNEQGKVDIDTGAVLLGADLLAALYSLVDTPEKFAAFVNDRARLSFYGDFLYPLASRSTREQFYREKPEGDFTPELRACRTAVWDALHAFRMRLLRLSPAAFIHFGTTRELRALMTEDVKQYAFLDWKRCVLGRASERYALNNVVVEPGCEIGADCYLEDSYVLEQSRVGAGAVLSHVTVRDREVPADVALHGLRLCDGRFVVRVYGVGDNPKEGDVPRRAACAPGRMAVPVGSGNLSRLRHAGAGCGRGAQSLRAGARRGRPRRLGNGGADEPACVVLMRRTRGSSSTGKRPCARRRRPRRCWKSPPARARLRKPRRFSRTARRPNDSGVG